MTIYLRCSGLYLALHRTNRWRCQVARWARPGLQTAPLPPPRAADGPGEARAGGGGSTGAQMRRYVSLCGYWRIRIKKPHNCCQQAGSWISLDVLLLEYRTRLQWQFLQSNAMSMYYYYYCEAQARVRQRSARDGSQGKRPQSLNPCLELTLKLVATHPPTVSLHPTNGLAVVR